MKLAEGVQTDQSFSNFTNENDDYATLIEMVSQAKKKIEYTKNVYTSELQGIPKRRKGYLNTLIVNGFFLILIVLFIAFFKATMASGGGIMFQAAETWIAVGVVIIALGYMIIRTIKSAIVYLMNTKPEILSVYIKRKGLKTLCDEDNYCRSVLKYMIQCEKAVSDIEKAMAAKTVDVPASEDIITKFNFDIPDFKFNAGRC